jgi:hypothetical protein
MANMKMSWRPEGGRLAGEWINSEATESYDAAWMHSPYPDEPTPRRSSSTNQHCHPSESPGMISKAL